MICVETGGTHESAPALFLRLLLTDTIALREQKLTLWMSKFIIIVS